MSVSQLNLDDITDPTCPLSIYRGSDYRTLTLFHPEDISAYSICGEIRDNYAHVAGNNLLATFLFEPLVFGSVTFPDMTTGNATTIIPYLTSAITDLLEPTRDRTITDRIRPGVNAYFYDIKIKSPLPDEVESPLIYGLVQVRPNVSTCL